MSLYHDQRGQGGDLVLLHGWGMNAAVWEPVLAPLADHHRLTIIELPGHGGSAPAAAADAGEWARMCLAVAPPRAVWLGWSLGGQIALRAALDAPDRVRGLSLVGATPCFVQAEDWSCAMPVDTFHQFADALGEDPSGTLIRFLALQVKGAEHAREALRLLRAELVLRPAASRAGLAQGLQLLLDTDLRARLRSLACPTQWLFGEKDTLVPRAIQGILPQLLPYARIDELPGAGHAPFLSHPWESVRALLSAIDGWGHG